MRLEKMEKMQGSQREEDENRMTSQMSSINQSLLDEQPSIAISQAFVDLERESNLNEEYSLLHAKEDPKNIKEAIIDLYLAIKIRSTEELDRINDGNLYDEKAKLMENFDCF